MRPTRSRRRTVFPLSAALLFCALVNAQSPEAPIQGKATLVYIGTGGAKGKGIHLFRLQEDVIPYVEANYRAFTDRDRRAIVGLSMGGGQALSIGLNNLDLFSRVAGFSSGLGSAANFPKTYANLISQPESANRKIRMLWVGCGAEDGAFAASKAFSEFLTKHNIKHTFRESGGAHTWIVWRRYLHEISPLLFQ